MDHGTSRKAGVLLAMMVFLTLVLVPIAAGAQGRTGIPRVGLLSFGSPPSSTDADPDKGFLQGLRDLGYVEGRNIVIERRYAAGQPEQLEAMAADLIRRSVDVVLAGGPGPREAARKATSTIPIVTISGSDPVREGWAQSLAHPGGNVTGLTVTFPELDLKRLELLKEARPGLERVSYLWAPGEFQRGASTEPLEVGARGLGLKLQVLDVRGPVDFEGAFGRARESSSQALLVVATNLSVSNRSQLAQLALQSRLLTISDFPLMAHAGFLMSYGADLEDLGRRSVSLMDKILKGTAPGDLPIERPVKLWLTINLRSARALGISIPQAVLVRADEVIE